MLVLAVALAVGIGVGLLTNATVPAVLLNYLAVIVLAGLDACLGGIRSSMEHTFSDGRFVAGLLFNVAMATFVVFLGDSVGLRELYLAAAVPFVIRMFSNVAAIRDLFLARHGLE